MKTSELIKRAKDEVMLKAVVEGLYIVFYEWDSEEEFYKYPIDGTDIGKGISYMWNIKDLFMKDLFNLGGLIKEYTETPVKERQEEKKYYVWYNNHLGRRNYLYLTENQNKIGYFTTEADDIWELKAKVGENEIDYYKLSTEHIQTLSKKWLPKEFGGIGFTECVEVKG